MSLCILMINKKSLEMKLPELVSTMPLVLINTHIIDTIIEKKRIQNGSAYVDD